MAAKSSKKNPFDLVPGEIQQNLIQDLQLAAKEECRVYLGRDDAERVVRALVAGKASVDALYRVQTSRLCTMVADLKKVGYVHSSFWRSARRGAAGNKRHIRFLEKI